MPNDMPERARRPVHDAHQSTWSMLDPRSSRGAPFLRPAGVKAKCTALQRVIGVEQPWEPFDGARDSITLDPNGYACNPTLSRPALCKEQQNPPDRHQNRPREAEPFTR